MKYLFFNDYSEGAHPAVLQLLVKTNFDQEAGYGVDSLGMAAQLLIKKQLKRKDVDIHFLSGGTQTNLIALSSMLKPYESVIAAETGHICVHEAGAIEATGHKIHTVTSADGKLTVEGIDAIVKAHVDEHMVKPRVVFISNSTELGTIYKKAELKKISDYCRKHGLYLYMDGARLGSGLMSKESDLKLSDLCGLVDMFYIGGTKNGALLGEALVIVNNDLKKNFRFHLKQHGALLAKGRALSTQFKALFTDNLFLDLAQSANVMAEELSTGIEKLGYKFLTKSSTNQIFPIFPDKVIKKLQKNYGFYIWGKADNGSSSIRLVTSWATRESAIQMFLHDLGKISR